MLDAMADQTPTTLLILGAGGDLTHRLLLPGLGSLLSVEPTRDVRVVGADREDKTSEEFGALITECFEPMGTDPEVTRGLCESARWEKTDVLDEGQLRTLIASCEAPLVIYFALPPAVSIKVCALLEKINLPQPTRLALEKPFGSDAASAHALNEQLLRLVPEEQIFRVDHFLGLSTVFNLIGLRFANRLFSQVWSTHDIEKVEIVYDETLALEGRAGYYDHAGAMKDMLQSHLLQVLAIFAMEPIAAVNAQELRDLTAQVLRATQLWAGDPSVASRRARYTAGRIGDRDVPDYTAEQGVDPELETETLAELTIEINNSRWAGVPFTLRSGKALGTARKQVIVTFRPVTHVPTGFTGDYEPDVLVIDLKPGAIALELTMNAEGSPLDLEHKVLNANLGDPHMVPYGEVLQGVLDGDPLLSVRGDAAEECWRIVTPVLSAWRRGAVPLESYQAGSDGPWS